MIINSINFSIAGIRFSYKYSCDFILSDKSPIKNFIDSFNQADVFNEIIITQDYSLLNDVINHGNKVFFTHSWSLYKYNNKDYYVFYPSDKKEIALLTSNDDFSDIKTYLYRLDFDNQPLPICITGFILQRRLLTLKKGFLMHGATIDVNGKGLILSGNSGVGKSTLSSLFFYKNCTQISDDRFALVKENNRYFSYGNPLDYKMHFNLNKKIEISHFLFLKHGSKNYLRAIENRDVIHKLIKISLLPYWEKSEMNVSLKQLYELSNTIPCFEYSFLPNETAADFILEWLKTK